MNREIENLIDDRNQYLEKLDITESIIEARFQEFLETLLGKYIVLKASTSSAVCKTTSYIRNCGLKNVKRIGNYRYYYLGKFDELNLKTTDEQEENYLCFNNKLIYVFGTYGDNDTYGHFLMTYKITDKNYIIEDDVVFIINPFNKETYEDGNFFIAFDTEDEAKLFMEAIE